MNKIPPSYVSLKNVEKSIKSLAPNPSAENYRNIKEMAVNTRKLAEKEIEQNLSNNKFSQKADKFITKVFENFAKFFNKKDGKNSDNLGKTIINSVLFGNIFKDLMTGIVSTSQSFTNTDYSKEKRLFMGSYDIAACLTTITLSYILGPMSVNKINKGYKNLLKPLKKMPAYNMALNGLSAVTLIVLQSIIAKRVIAPAISTPLAAKMKKKLEN